MGTDLSSVFSGENAKPVRSTFLTVLCVLTIVSSLYYLFSGYKTYTGAEQASAEIVKQKQKMKEDLAKDTSSADQKGKAIAMKIADSMDMYSDPVKLKQSGIATVVANLLTLAGAVLMFMLKRIGFYTYVVGTIGGLIASFVIYGSGNLISNLGILFSGFFGLAFIVMYAFNLKDMKA